MTKWADGVTGIIYGLYDNTGLRYIGQTTCAPRVRLQAHIAGYSKAKDSPRVRWLREMRSRGEVPMLLPIEAASSKEELDRLEAAYIENAKDSGHNLVNLMIGRGGRANNPKGISGYRHTWVRRDTGTN